MHRPRQNKSAWLAKIGSVKAKTIEPLQRQTLIAIRQQAGWCQEYSLRNSQDSWRVEAVICEKMFVRNKVSFG